ncbi:hypothetical protein [Burkholderia ambifaria]|uniref:hypothetical protein n=1 Tax=Burkholderia ambifaria TaxID=152480 RepID=UPI00159075B4|nr:hypothetical protein [Burkholderia ambifaria]
MAASTEDAPLGEIAFTIDSSHGVKAREVKQRVWLQHIDLLAGVGQSVSVVTRKIDALGGIGPI